MRRAFLVIVCAVAMASAPSVWGGTAASGAGPAPAAPVERVLPPPGPLPPLSPAAPSPLASPAPGPVAPAAPPVLPPSVAAPAEPTPAAPSPTEPAKPVYPYTGYITGDLVNVRSGPGMYYYTLGTLNKDARVTVEGEQNGWLALRPTEGVCGLIRKSEVTIDATGKKGTVSAPEARVYAFSPSAKRRWCVTATLKQGDTVKVLGPAEGDMIRIAAPESARVYVVSEYVAATSSTPSAAESALAKIEIEPPKVDPQVEEYKKIDADLRAELAKPLGERKYDDVAARFKDLAAKAEKPYLKQSCLERAAYIDAMRKEQDEYLKVVDLEKRLDQRLASLREQRATQAAVAATERRAERSDFLATGLVARMDSLDDVDYPIKHKLVDQNNRPLVLLKSTAHDLNKYLGKVVGVRGTKTYLKEWRIYVVTVDEVEVLE